jgi:hypothetical protein
MATSFSLLRVVGEAVAKYTLNTAAFGLPVGDILVEISKEAMRKWTQQAPEKQRQEEVVALAHATAEETRRQVSEIVQTEFAHLAHQLQQEMANYLTQVAANYRRRSTRLVTAGSESVVMPVALADPEELVVLLPAIPPSFNPSAAMRRMTDQEIRKLLAHDHSINGGIILGLEGRVVEVQGRAMRKLANPCAWRGAARVSGMARGAISEVIDRLAGAFAKLKIPDPQVLC